MTRFTSRSMLVMSIMALVAFGLVAVFDYSAVTSFAQEATEAVAEVAVEEEAVEEAAEEVVLVNAYSFNTIMMFLFAVLVLFMQAGFALVEVGLNGSKNVVNILSKNVLDLCIGVVLYLLLGFGIMYADEDKMIIPGWFGYDGPFVMLEETTDGLVSGYSPSADFMFQVAFAATAATIVSGAVAGRLKFGAYLVYTVFLTGLVYPISGYWKWGGGWLNSEPWFFQDFAGSIVVHAVGGFAGLAGALLLGPRLGRYTADGRSVPMPGHNITFAALGVFILLIGWYGFNPGSNLAYSSAGEASATTYIALTTTLAAATGGLAGLFLAWAWFGKPDLTMALNGILGGLVGITANCDRVSQGEALLIGAIAGVIVVLGVVLLDKIRIDDPVGAFPVHGMCGLWGGIATGIFGDIPDGLSSRGTFILNQTIGSFVIIAWAFLTMFLLFFVLKMVGFLRVSPEHEKEGLDISEHGMHAYPSESMMSGTM